METNIVIAFLVFVVDGVLGQRRVGNLPPLSSFPVSQNRGTLPPLGGSTRNGVPVPPIGAIPPPNTAFTSNPNPPPTPPPWIPALSGQNAANIGAIPTAQSSPSSTITFVSVSGSFPSVSIPDNGYDDHYVTIKSMFDTYYPNVPPLRRAENRATLQIFQGGTGVASTAVVSDDPTTVYIQYALPQQSAYAYLPFASDNTRRLKYPERPIYLPYPQLAVRIPTTGEIFPVYIPFQPAENRRNREEPEMFIPSIVPGNNLPLYEAALPAAPTTFSTNTQFPSETINGIAPTQPGTQQPGRNSVGVQEVTSQGSGSESSNLVIPLGGPSPKWNDLRITWDYNSTNPGLVTNPAAFAQLPLKESDAIIDGFTLLTDCSGSMNFVGKRYWRNNDPAVVLIYDTQGLIAGLQTGIPDNLPNGYPTSNLKPRPFVQEGNLLFVTVYFMDPSKICSSTRTEIQVISDGIGTGLYFQNGPSALTDTVSVPSDESTIKETLWGQGQCVPQLGNQYHYNVRKDMYCEELAPLLLMYDRGKLVGFAWFFVSDISSPVYEKIPPPMYSRMFQPVPDCLYTMGQVTSLHIFLTNQYNEISCSSK
ncbi:uncharacterized protein LOC125660415 [Ostrea edulis]|uniref:uncharacterized protein LOC125660415 n=1 Tax=Ostrea edulis TaxID=37623 RepID=UPI0024AEDCC0|nr:uncharacterized protein LOC125660415 [Ostrea edulis]